MPSLTEHGESSGGDSELSDDDADLERFINDVERQIDDDADDDDDDDDDMADTAAELALC